jgi:uncharacterized protein
MGIDPSSERIVPFYERMRELHMVLLSHTGDEHALEVSGGQQLGNPLLLRRPLDLGLTVVALHCGATGDGEDLESPGRERVSNFDLFLRLLEDPRYDGRLFGETSTLTISRFLGRPLRVLLGRPDLHRRLVHGSDYPIPGINAAIRPSRLAKEGFIAKEEVAPLDEIYARNPLLFDFVVQRTVRHPETGRRFDPCVFTAPPQLR